MRMRGLWNVLFANIVLTRQLVGAQPIDVILGGGRALFDYHRQDGRDLLAEHADT